MRNIWLSLVTTRLVWGCGYISFSHDVKHRNAIFKRTWNLAVNNIFVLQPVTLVLEKKKLSNFIYVHLDFTSFEVYSCAKALSTSLFLVLLLHRNPIKMSWVIIRGSAITAFLYKESTEYHVEKQPYYKTFPTAVSSRACNTTVKFNRNNSTKGQNNVALSSS